MKRIKMEMKKKIFKITYEGDLPPSIKDMKTAMDRGFIDEGGSVKVEEIEPDELREIVEEKIKIIKKDGKKQQR